MLSSVATLSPTDCGEPVVHCFVGHALCASAEKAGAANPMTTATTDRRRVRTRPPASKYTHAQRYARRSYICLPLQSMLPSLLGPRGRLPERFPRQPPSTACQLISSRRSPLAASASAMRAAHSRSEEHTSELQSH